MQRLPTRSSRPRRLLATLMLVFPRSSSVGRRLASLHRIARGSLLRLPRYHQGAPTSCRPSRPTRSRSSGNTTHFCHTRGSGESPLAGASSVLRRCLNPLPSCALVEIGRISQVLGQPLREHALLFDPGGPDGSGHKTHPMLPSLRLTRSAPRSGTFRGSSHGLFARCLRFAARITPNGHHARLATR
jgi:hypothetical protein